MKRPLVGPFLVDFIVMRKLNKPGPKDRCCLWNFFVFGILVHEKKSFKCISLYKPI